MSSNQSIKRSTEEQREFWRIQSRASYQRLKQRPEQYQKRLAQNAHFFKKLTPEERKERRKRYAHTAYVSLKADPDRYARRQAYWKTWKTRKRLLADTPLPFEAVIAVVLPYFSQREDL